MESRVYLAFTSFERGSHNNELLIGLEAVEQYMLNVVDGYTTNNRAEKNKIKKFIERLNNGTEKLYDGNCWFEFDDESWVTITYLGDKPTKIMTEALIKANPSKRNKK